VIKPSGAGCLVALPKPRGSAKGLLLMNLETAAQGGRHSGKRPNRKPNLCCLNRDEDLSIASCVTLTAE